jgi:hypothetical protein
MRSKMQHSTRVIADDALFRALQSGGSVVPTAIIFKPGAVAKGNVTPSAQTVSDGLKAGLINGAVTVYLDNSIAPCALPAGVTWDFQGCGGVCGVQGSPVTLTIEDGAQIVDIATVENAVLTCESQTLPSLSFTYTRIPFLWLKRSATLKTDGVATLAPVQVPAGGAFGLGMAEGSVFSNATPGVPLVELGAGARMIFFVFQALSLAGTSTAVSGTSGILEWIGDATAYPAPAFPNFTGTLLVVQPIESAPGVRYSSTAPSGTWVGSPPLTVQAALDRIASAFGASVGPIP